MLRSCVPCTNGISLSLCNRLKKRNEDALNKKLEENLSKEMRIKEKRDQANLDKKRRNEKVSRTKNTILKTRAAMVSRIGPYWTAMHR